MNQPPAKLLGIERLEGDRVRILWSSPCRGCGEEVRGMTEGTETTDGEGHTTTRSWKSDAWCPACRSRMAYNDAKVTVATWLLGAMCGWLLHALVAR